MQGNSWKLGSLAALLCWLCCPAALLLYCSAFCSALLSALLCFPLCSALRSVFCHVVCSAIRSALLSALLSAAAFYTSFCSALCFIPVNLLVRRLFDYVGNCCGLPSEDLLEMVYTSKWSPKLNPNGSQMAPQRPVGASWPA